MALGCLPRLHRHPGHELGKTQRSPLRDQTLEISESGRVAFTCLSSIATLPDMVEAWTIRNLAWAATTVLELVLLFLLFRRKLYLLHPAFSVYISTTVLQSLFGAWASHHWGGQSMRYFNFAWGAQGVVICVRWVAVIEVARRVLAAYSGIWKLASGILFILCIFILVYSVVVPRTAWYLSVLSADRAVEFSIASFIVGLLAFARYYRLSMTNLERLLCIGFCLFSCSWVISDTIYQGAQHPAGMWWEFFEILAFFATLLLWVDAVRKPFEVHQPATAPALSRDQYANASQQLNARLDQLNNRLSHLLHSGDARS